MLTFRYFLHQAANLLSLWLHCRKRNLCIFTPYVFINVHKGISQFLGYQSSKSRFSGACGTHNHNARCHLTHLRKLKFHYFYTVFTHLLHQLQLYSVKPKCFAIVSQTSSLVSLPSSSRTTVKKPLFAHSS